MNVFHFRRSGVAGGPMKVREANRKMGVIIKKKEKGDGGENERRRWVKGQWGQK